jgi:WD40 repeat protein
MKPFIVVVCLLTALPCSAAPSYERDITPILRTYCSGCHNDRDKEGELSVETFASFRKGGVGSGDPVVPGDSAASVMIQRILSSDGDHMPPDDEPQVPAADRAVLEAWIAAGAPAPAVDASLLQSLVVPKLPPHVGVMPVTAAAVTPDGGRVAVVRGRGLMVVPASAGGAAVPPGQMAAIDLPWKANAVHFSPDGKAFVVAGGVAGLSGVAELRDPATGSLIRSFGGHRDVLYDAEFSPDGKLLATAGYDRSLKLWNVADGSLLRSIDVHNGAIFDLAWHPSGKLLGSASADETIKLWRASDGLRLDTLNQPQGEMFTVAFTPDGKHVIGGGRDKRVHLWKLVSLDAPTINPPLHSRFAHESPVVAIGLSADGRHLLTTAEDRSLKCWSVPDLVLEHDYPRQPDQISAVVPLTDGRFGVGRMDGSLDVVTVVVDPVTGSVAGGGEGAGGPSLPPAAAASPSAVAEHEPNDAPQQAIAVSVPVEIKGTIGRPGDADCFRFAAQRGVPLLIEVNAARSKSLLDSRIEVLDAAGKPVEQIVLQANRDSWFTFRGKDSTQSGDFRLQNWMEMELDEYLYANGEVVRLWRYPQGPDSGFMVYPGSGSRQTFFGTSAVTHALGEPAWIVQPLPPGTTPAPNGLPVFRVFYENDDEATQRFGADSQIIFTPPADGDFIVRLTDVRGAGSASKPDDYRYALIIRSPQPSFSIEVGGKDPKVSPGSGRELTFTAKRSEGFEGPIQVALDNLPAGFMFHGPVEIEAGQRQAIGVLSASVPATAEAEKKEPEDAEPEDAGKAAEKASEKYPDEEADKAVVVKATATIAGVEVVKEFGSLGNIQIAEKPKVTVAIAPGPDVSAAMQPTGGPLEFSIRPGQTITARVKAERHDFTGRIELGGADSGRNLPYGVFVDNIGLNGLLIVEGQTEREFFITAAPIAKPCRRLFHLRTTADGNQASVPAVINVLPAE